MKELKEQSEKDDSNGARVDQVARENAGATSEKLFIKKVMKVTKLTRRNGSMINGYYTGAKLDDKYGGKMELAI